ncbi:MAG: VWA domain-containing protein [Syntrophotaleaceae bacterium]
MRGLRASSWKRHYDDLFFIAVITCLVLALANPGYARRTVEQFIESKWIILTLDLSGSMRRQIDRFSQATVGDVALEGLESFVDLRREGDYIGLVAFSSFARLLAPLTSDRGLLKRKLKLVHSQNQSRVYHELGAGGGTNASEAVWLALSVFFSMLPEEQRLTTEEIGGMRQFLLGEPGSVLDIPLKLRRSGLGTGMAVILFTDGRIEPRLRAHVRQGQLPNLINIVALMKTLDIRFYIIAVGGQVDATVEEAMQPMAGQPAIGRIFPLARGFDREQIQQIYREIDALEANRNLIRSTVRPRWTRPWFLAAALGLMLAGLALGALPGYRRY